MRIPGQREAIPTLTPLAQAPSAPAATLPVLTPLPSAPVNPFGGMGTFAPAPPSPPVPRVPTAGLTPLPASPLPNEFLPLLAPLSADPLAGLPAANPLGIPPSKMGGTLNPYSSPAATSYNQAAYQPRQITDRHRRGLPWEVDPSMDSFGDTMNLVLGSPQEAFQMMRRSGGVGNPMGFFIIGGVIGQIANSIYATIAEAIFYSTLDAPFPIEVLAITGAIRLIGGIFVVILSGVIGMFISAAIGHLSLMAVGGANAGYEATYRVLCFGAGSIAVLNAIPLIGPLIGMFYVLVILIHGYTHAHEIPGGKATLAVFLPVLVIPCLCCVPVGFLSLGGLLSCLGIQL